jgi:hypothetical protein
MRFARFVAAGACSVAVAACSLVTDLSGLGGPPNVSDSSAAADAPVSSSGGPGQDANFAAVVDAGWDADSASAGGAYRLSVLADKPVGYWRLGEAPGAKTATNESGLSVGSYLGQVTLGVPGAIPSETDTAAKFGGAGSVDLGDVLDVGGGDFTLEMWLLPEELAAGTGYSEHYLVSKFLGNGYHLFYSSPYMSGGNPIGSRLEFEFCTPAGCTSLGAAVPTSATHLVVVRDATSIALYMNVAELDRKPCNTRIAESHAPFVMGAGSTTGGYYTGLLDEVAVYNVALPLDRIRAHYLASK